MAKNKKIKVGFISLGCPKNQIDIERMLNMVDEEGSFEITSEDYEADVIIINTCAFIESAKQESIENILDVAWLKENRSLKSIIVTGCLAERYREQIFTQLPEVDAVVGVGSCTEIVRAIKATLKGKRFSSFEDKNTSELGGDRILTTPFYSAYLKIAEGCDNRCTYCAIPDIRGRFRSRPMEEIIEEAKKLEASGVKELNIVAQDTTRYGLDLYGDYKLAELVHKISEETSFPWIRLMYCYPDKITDELIEEFKTNKKLVKYIDLPIQHISDRMLKRMNRHGGSDTIKEAIAKLRSVDGMVIRTTVIVGFPGETEEDFEELCKFIKDTKFDKFGAFTYSREEDTPAYDFPDQIDEQVKQDRYDIIMREQQTVLDELNEKKVGKLITVIVEGYDPDNKIFFGRCPTDAPEIDSKVYFTGAKQLRIGSFVNVRVSECMDYDYYGELLGDIN